MINDSWTGGQYSLYRTLLGAYLLTHFIMLMPYGAELFAAGGMLATAALSPYIGVVPNPLAWCDSPASVLCLLVSEPCAARRW